MVRCCATDCCDNDYKCCNYKCHNNCNYFEFNEFYITENCILKKFDDNTDNLYNCCQCILGTPISMVLDIITCPFRSVCFCCNECYCVKIKNTITQQPQPQIQNSITEQPKNKKIKQPKFSDKPPDYNQHHIDSVVISLPESLPPRYQ